MNQKLENISGLTDVQVRERISQGEQNLYQTRSSRSYGRIIFENIFSFFNILLMLSVSFLIALGSKDVLLTTFLLVFNIIFGLVQELRAKFMLDKLSLLTYRFVTVRRNGKNTKIPIADIVKDDIIVLSQGDQIVVDGHLISSQSLEVDESSLTGESKYRAKDKDEMLYSGSYCVAGSGMMKAELIGKTSNINKFRQSSREYKLNRSPLENHLAKILKLIIAIIAIFGPLTLIAGINIKLTFSNSVENMVNLLIILVPQGLITSVSILFTLGAFRISKNNTIVQKINAIEFMGHSKIICIDKTGTLTKNILSLQNIIPFEEPLEGVRQKLSMFAHNITAPNQIILTIRNKFKLWQKRASKVEEIPFQSKRKWSGITFDTGNSIILGSPEILLNEKEHLNLADKYSAQGFQVLALAASNESLNHHNPKLPSRLKLLAIIIFNDELRPDVANTLTEFDVLGIQIKIISGDKAETVQSVARQSGIVHNHTISQDQLSGMKSQEFDKTVKNYSVFARIEPDMKAKIIASLIRQNNNVAMIGDGVNDVLALKKAKVSIAMSSGAQITKDISDIILLDNAFATLPKAIKEGRDITLRIYAIAKIFFVKVTYFMVLFLLVGFANLPFPISLRQTTLLSFMITGIPMILITLKILQPARQQHPSKDFVEYTLLAGIIGGLAMTYLTVVTMTILKQDIVLSRTLNTMFASFYSCIVLLNIVGISLFDYVSILKNKFAAMIIAILCLESILLPVYFMPNLFNLVKLTLHHWIILVLLVSFCAYILSFFNGKLHLKKIWEDIYE